MFSVDSCVRILYCIQSFLSSIFIIKTEDHRYNLFWLSWEQSWRQDRAIGLESEQECLTLQSPYTTEMCVGLAKWMSAEIWQRWLDAGKTNAGI